MKVSHFKYVGVDFFFNAKKILREEHMNQNYNIKFKLQRNAIKEKQKSSSIFVSNCPQFAIIMTPMEILQNEINK